WSSSSSTVASVDGSGLVTAVTPGAATITATAADGSGVNGSLALTILPTPVAAISVVSAGSLVVSGGAPVDFGTVFTTSSSTLAFTI
ncbi:Ig-like domain-containing protein, partial [Acinetobacter baumannii]